MHITALRVGLSLLWGGVGLGLLTRSWWAGAALDARAAGRDLTLFGVVALALAGWNLFRVAATQVRRDRVDLATELADRRARREQTAPDSEPRGFRAD